MNLLQKHIVLFTLFTTIIPQVSFSQSNCITTYWSENITTFEEDSANLWIGTKEHGLVKFDKNTHVKTYFDTTNSSISSNKISSLLIYDDKLIVSTDSSLLRFENGIFTTITDTIRNGLLIADNANKLVVAEVHANVKNKIYFLQNDTIVHTLNLVGGGFAMENIDLTKDDSGNMWLVQNIFYNFDLFKFDSLSYQVFNNSNTAFVGPNPFGSSITSRGDSLYLALSDGIYKYNNSWELQYKSQFPNVEIINGTDSIKRSITALDWDINGDLWCGAVSSDINEFQLAYLSDSIWNFLPPMDSTSSYISKIHISSFDNNIVFVGSKNGLQIIDKNCLNSITSILETNRGIDITIFPIPSTGNIKIQYSEGIVIQKMTLLDINGKKISQLNSNQHSFDLDI